MLFCQNICEWNFLLSIRNNFKITFLLTIISCIQRYHIMSAQQKIRHKRNSNSPGSWRTLLFCWKDNNVFTCVKHLFVLNLFCSIIIYLYLLWLAEWMVIIKDAVYLIWKLRWGFLYDWQTPGIFLPILKNDSKCTFIWHLGWLNFEKSLGIFRRTPQGTRVVLSNGSC